VRTPLIAVSEALRERIVKPAQLSVTAPASGLPPYLESFLAHLRLLVGVPFDYLVPDARLLPTESVRFFFIDRSWTDRLVDGVISVGELGSREQAHHHAHGPDVQSTLDGMERYVRDLQRGWLTYEQASDAALAGGGVITGFLMRSSAVSGWPHMDVRAFDRELELYPDEQEMTAASLQTLRLERLSPAVLIALFDGVPRLVWCEEPHHGVQFGVRVDAGTVDLARRTVIGQAEDEAVHPPIDVPFRSGDRRVIHAVELRRRLEHARTTPPPAEPQMPAQQGSADFAVEVLQPPWRQRFQRHRDGGRVGDGSFVLNASMVARRALEPDVRQRIEVLLQP
jgi:hypothetical protein